MSPKPEWMQKGSHAEERKLLIDSEREAARSFDKAMITLSAGALAISITFVREIAPRPVGLGLVFAAWGGFVLALLAILFSFLCSQSAMRKQRKTIGADFARVKPAGGQANAWRTAVNVLNWACIIFFISGVILLALFAGTNLCQKEIAMSDEPINTADLPPDELPVEPAEPPPEPDEPGSPQDSD